MAATFLLLEPEPGRVARAIELALAGLRAFLDTAFEADGSSTEGVAYWHYGLINFVALERLEEQSRANAKPGVLKRMSFVLPATAQAQARVRMEIQWTS